MNPCGCKHFVWHCMQLRERESRLGELVDMVVENYHPGFARSIQNYSQILQLFQDSKEQVGPCRNLTPWFMRTLTLCW